MALTLEHRNHVENGLLNAEATAGTVITVASSVITVVKKVLDGQLVFLPFVWRKSPGNTVKATAQTFCSTSQHLEGQRSD